MKGVRRRQWSTAASPVSWADHRGGGSIMMVINVGNRQNLMDNLNDGANYDHVVKTNTEGGESKRLGSAMVT